MAQGYGQSRTICAPVTKYGSAASAGRSSSYMARAASAERETFVLLAKQPRHEAPGSGPRVFG
jgi:hypothetical protein